MKQMLLLIGCIYLILSSFSLSAQDQKFEVGIEGGAGATYIYGNSVCKDIIQPLKDRAACDIKVIRGGTAGLVFRYNFISHFSLQTGISYERKGAEFAYSDGRYYHDFLYHFDYLTIPVLIRTNWGKIVRFTASAGPYFSYLLQQKYLDAKSKTVLTPDTFFLDIDPQSFANKQSFDAGIILSIGGEVTLWKNLSLSLEVSDHLGLMDTKKQVHYYASLYKDNKPDSRSFNNSMLLSLGFAYGFGKSLK